MKTKRQPRHYTREQLPWEQREGYKFARLRLEKGDTFPNPVCGDCLLHGPMVLEFRQFPDGGLDTYIAEGFDGHAVW